MYVKSEALALVEDKQEFSCKKSAAKEGIHLVIKVGDQIKCPECETLGRVVWVSEDKKTMGVKCLASHREVGRPQAKYGARVIASTKTRKNVVFLTAIAW
jgi:hypothetical protein